MAAQSNASAGRGYDPLQIDTSWAYRLGSWASPVLLIWVAWLGFSRGSGVPPVALIIGLLGVAMGVVALFDSPVWVRFGDDGVVRRCPLRQVEYRWDDVISLVRPSRRQSLLGRLVGGQAAAGGLAIRRESGKVLLYTHRERPDQRDAVERLLAAVAPGIDMPE